MYLSKILVTGSEGLIGSLVCKKLEKKYNLVRFDLKNGHDVVKRKQVEQALKGCDGVIHLAALSRVVTAHKKPLEAVRNNIMGTANILESIRIMNPKIWCIYASSREVYGENKKILKETDPVKPINVYGVTKLSAELLTESYDRNYGMNSAIVRFSNVYGALNDHVDRVVPKFLGQASNGKDVTVYGGTQTFDFVHVEDATEALVKLVERINGSKLKRKTFHFVTGKGTNLMELARKIIEITHSSSEIKKMEARDYDVNHFIGNPQFAKDELDWQAKINLESGLKRYWQIYKTQLE